MAARALTGATAGHLRRVGRARSCTTAKPEYEPYYFSSSGTSMAAPHVTGAIAVVQSAAQARLGRR